MEKNIKLKIQQIHHVLNTASFQVNQAKNLLKEIEADVLSKAVENIPGVFGKFVGDAMITDAGQKIEVPLNYASKSALVCGDKLKMYEENGEKRFKQVERVKRFRAEGILAKKEGKWHVVTSDGSYKVLDSSIEHWGGVEGDMVVILLPLDDKFAPFGALESIVGKSPKSSPKIEIEIKPNEETKEAVKEVVKAPVEHLENVNVVASDKVSSVSPVPVAAVGVAVTKVPAERHVERILVPSAREAKEAPVKTKVGTTTVSRVSKGRVGVPTKQSQRVESVVAHEVQKEEVPIKTVAKQVAEPSRVLTDEDLR